MAAKECLFCGGKADLLCDSKLGWERARGDISAEAPHLLTAPSHEIPVRYRRIHTCDAALCRACAVAGGWTHFHFKSGPFIETIDYCPGHEQVDMRIEITVFVADCMRAKWRAKACAARGDGVQDSSQLDMFRARP